MSYTKVHAEIINYVERKRDTVNDDIKAMEVDHFDSDYHYGDWDWWQDDTEYEQLNYFQKGGKGGEGGEGKGYYYGGKGGYEKGGGEGKGFEDRGGKGGYEKGEGKGEGFQGVCNWCGTWGRTASKCMKKDKHMQEYRQADGIPEQSGRRPEKVDCPPARTSPRSPRSLQHQSRRRWRWTLCSPLAATDCCAAWTRFYSGIATQSSNLMKIQALEASVIIATKDFHRDFGPDYKTDK
jgi:hypothetical protein